jgi:16S rRNA (cytosine1402-N4)-methyltransferase
MEHIPVLLEEVIAHFPEVQDHSPCMLDATFGRGGHSRALMNRHPSLRVYACDWDAAAEQHAQKEFHHELETGRLHFYRCSYAKVEEAFSHWGLSLPAMHYILADLGVSSPQLDEPSRGFSFYESGPLDMRMDRRRKTTAADLVNELTEQELIELFQSYGEVRSPYRVARAIVHDRKENPFTDTVQLASLIERVDGWRKKGVHPATLYFQALRIAVNAELEDLEVALPIFLAALKPGGRLAIISFHSLEDRLIKQTFKSWEERAGKRVQRKVIKPSEEEVKRNPRARSAKLRVFEKSGGEI